MILMLPLYSATPITPLEGFSSSPDPRLEAGDRSQLREVSTKPTSGTRKRRLPTSTEDSTRVSASNAPLRDALDAVMREAHVEDGDSAVGNPPRRQDSAEPPQTPAGVSEVSPDLAYPGGARAELGSLLGANLGETVPGQLPLVPGAVPDTGRPGKSAPGVSTDPSRVPAAISGDRRNLGGRPTAVDLAARDPKQQRLAFATAPVSLGTHGSAEVGRPLGEGTTRRATLAPPPAVPERPRNKLGTSAPERSTGAPATGPEATATAAIHAIRNGKGESLTKEQLLAVILGLLTGSIPLGAHTAGAGAAGRSGLPVAESTQGHHSAPKTRSRRVRDAQEGAALTLPWDDDVTMNDHQGESPANHAPHPPSAQETNADFVDVWADYEPTPSDLGDVSDGDEWECFDGRKPKGAARVVPAPQVSPPTSTQTPIPPKRVALRVSPPKAKAGEGDKTTPDTKVVFDGIPKGTTFLGFSRILDRFYAACAGRPGSDFPVAPLTASTHLMGQGGWVVSYWDADVATRVLGQDPALLAAAAGIDPTVADIHRPGMKTRRGEQVSAKTARSVFMHLEPTVLGEIWDEVRTNIAKKDIEDPQWAPYRDLDRTGQKRQPAIPTIPAHRVMLEQALMGLLQAPEGSAFETLQVLGKTGAIIGVLPSAEAATRAIAEGIRAPALARRIVARAAHSPDQRGGLSFCTRCLGVGHRPHQCDQKPRCRVCGASGHPESNGECPKRKRHPSHPKGNGPFCVLCGLSGHKAGAPSCVEMQRTRKALAKGPDGTFADAVKAARAARVEAAKVSAKSVSPGVKGNAWVTPLPGTGAARARPDGVGATSSTQQHSQSDLKMDRLERALHDMQAQMAEIMQIIMAGHVSSALGASQLSQVQESDRQVASSLNMHD